MPKQQKSHGYFIFIKINIDSTLDLSQKGQKSSIGDGYWLFIVYNFTYFSQYANGTFIIRVEASQFDSITRKKTIKRKKAGLSGLMFYVDQILPIENYRNNKHHTANKVFIWTKGKQGTKTPRSTHNLYHENQWHFKEDEVTHDDWII